MFLKKLSSVFSVLFSHHSRLASEEPCVSSRHGIDQAFKPFLSDGINSNDIKNTDFSENLLLIINH